jgi:hypothetical protein
VLSRDRRPIACRPASVIMSAAPLPQVSRPPFPSNAGNRAKASSGASLTARIGHVPAALDRLAPTTFARAPAARQHPLPDAEIDGVETERLPCFCWPAITVGALGQFPYV